MGYWRRLSAWQQDVLLATLIGVVWFSGLAVINDSWLRPKNPSVSVVTGVFLVLTVALVRQIPWVTLVFVGVFYPLVYASAETGLAEQLGLDILRAPAISDAALQSELHLVPLLVVGYLAAASGVRRLTTLFFTMGSLAALMIGLPAVVAIVLSNSPREVFYGDRYQNLPRSISSLYSYIDVSLFVFAEALICGMVLLGANALRRRKSLLVMEQRNNALVRLRTIEAERAAAAERTRIARDLHDVVSHHMSAVVIRAQAADRVADQKPEALREAVRWIAASGREALTAMRETVRVLNNASPGAGAEMAPVPGLSDVARMGERLKAVGIDVTMQLPTRNRQMTSATDLTAVRIIQEALTNVMVHAKATAAHVSWQSGPQGELLTIDDNGSGGPPPVNALETARRQESGRGNGLIGMRERAHASGGTLTVAAGPLGGWRVQAWLPPQR
ncbi:histidine kinase [Streptomyces sp. SID13031]|uniref:sensor histidine kinase n=1 Tax=Streptomyces sp. SID13031 TaxID=2706046 RepID=UPI0013C9855C|nr:histidine kinase [Streptomyces sp. SID13031]NEA35035.1 two-component sensor histidine kinase [Streptomyces sp. SID13031]